MTPVDLTPLKEVAAKIEDDVLKDLGTLLVPAVLKEAVSLLPDAYKQLGAGILSVLEPQLQKALDDVLAKIPKV